MSADAPTMTLDDLPPVASPEQVAQALGMAPKTIRAACRRGELRAARLAGHWRIRRDDVLAKFTGGGPTTPAAAPERPAQLLVTSIAPRGRPGRPRKRRRTRAV
jgi:excisionase family DNA binding protein